ncbi:hypothetical protein NAU58_04200 [Pseudomonas stutzeri]|uniref:Translation initiation factor 2 n=1 Tax=Stutzerimonas stutzeri TaxID=316 RepID=A0A2N8S759_STUST|nr:hypothetical protein [Stutzerimonas stutzeri]MCQ4294774.1 hypothetical protein [Stutzerimonas stutzeri]PNF82461.1 hypothetical protein CXK92_03115 [Stutzerimonas stutzeri]
MHRPLLLVLLSLALLGGCGDDDAKPEQATAPGQPTQAPVTDEPAEGPPDLEIELAPAEESANADRPDVQINIPEPEPEPDPEPEPTAVPAPKPVSAPAKRQAAVKPAEDELPAPVLDLHLPEELAQELMPTVNAEAAQLLPPLFGAGKAQSMQIGGRLISSEDDDEALIDGAEIRFEFKR